MSEPLQDQVSDPTAAGLDAAYCIPDAHGRCITCSDELQRATVLAVDQALLMAQADIDGEHFDIDISLVAGVKAGDVLLVHGGVALDQT